MALKGWIGPLCTVPETPEIDEGHPGADAWGAAVAPDHAEMPAMPTEAASPGSTGTAPVVPASWHPRGPAELASEHPGERRVERRRAERRGLVDLVGADAQVFSVAFTRRDVVLMGCCTVVGFLVGSVFF